MSRIIHRRPVRRRRLGVAVALAAAVLLPAAPRTPPPTGTGATTSSAAPPGSSRPRVRTRPRPRTVPWRDGASPSARRAAAGPPGQRHLRGHLRRHQGRVRQEAGRRGDRLRSRGGHRGRQHASGPGRHSAPVDRRRGHRRSRCWRTSARCAARTAWSARSTSSPPPAAVARCKNGQRGRPGPGQPGRARLQADSSAATRARQRTTGRTSPPMSASRCRARWSPRVCLVLALRRRASAGA